MIIGSMRIVAKMKIDEYYLVSRRKKRKTRLFERNAYGNVKENLY